MFTRDVQHPRSSASSDQRLYACFPGSQSLSRLACAYPQSAKRSSHTLPGGYSGDAGHSSSNTTYTCTRHSATLSERPSIFNLLDQRENNNHREEEEGAGGRKQESILGGENDLRLDDARHGQRFL